MKNFALVLNVILLAAVIVLFVLHFNSPKQATSNQEESAKVERRDSLAPLNVAYVNSDSVLLKYDLAIDLNENFMSKTEKSRTDFNERRKSFERQAAEFQRKVENNGFLSLERAESEQRRLQEEQLKLQELDATLSNELAKEQRIMNQRVTDSILNYIQVYNSEQTYDLIFSTVKGGTILWGDQGMDITDEVIEDLNNRYAASK